MSAGADQLALGALEATLAHARERGDDRPALEVLAGTLARLGITPAPPLKAASSGPPSGLEADSPRGASTDSQPALGPTRRRETRPDATTEPSPSPGAKDSLRSGQSSDLIGYRDEPSGWTPSITTPTPADRSPAALVEPNDPLPPAPHAVSAERWLTKRDLAAALDVSQRWIETQQQRGMPHLRMGGMNRYQLPAIERWLQDEYGPSKES